jgi:thiol:disulfide interchange protein
MRRLFLCLVFLLAAAAPAMAQIDPLPKVQVKLISDRDAVRPGDTLSVALEQDIRNGWHTYWSNPGEAGMPTEIHWTLPPGWSAGAIAWPYPQREQVGPLMDYGYEGKLWLLTSLTASADAKPGLTNFSAHVLWLVCREVCVPEDATVTLQVVVDAAAAPPEAASLAEFAAARAKIPAASPWPMHFARGKDLRLYVQAPALSGVAKPVAVQFFPASSGLIVDAAPQTFTAVNNGLVLQLAHGTKSFDTLTGVLVLTSSDKSVQALEVKATPGVVPEIATPASTSKIGILLALLFAFLGGVILNVMPCVLPVLAMKALALASHAGAARHHARAESFSYSLGAILSFVAFGLLIVALRAGGVAIGWGFQLQEPLVVTVLALLMLAVGLNLSGLFEFQPVQAGEALTRKNGNAGAFFTGVLAVAVAAPCTAPFMATAIGYGFTQPPLVVLAVFVALGLGFALPFLLLGLWPALHRILPKPGTWMVKLKQILALPMYATAAWLVWVLAQQVDHNGLIAAGGAILALALGLWLWGATRSKSDWLRKSGTVLAFFCAAGVLYGLSFVTTAKPQEQPAPKPVHAGIASEPYSAARLEALRGQGRPVFIDATASWCITCLVNEEAALSRPKVQAAFKSKHIALLVADWTNSNPAVTALLQAHGRSGVPLYLYYAPGAKEPQILPQLLTEGEVLKTLE